MGTDGSKLGFGSFDELEVVKEFDQKGGQCEGYDSSHEGETEDVGQIGGALQYG